MVSFSHIFVGIGNNGSKVVQNIDIKRTPKIVINPTYYLLGRSSFRQNLKELFWNIPDDAILWFILENKPVNVEIMQIILEYVPRKPLKLAYLLTPQRELINEEKPQWAENFDTVFYDSLWEFLDEYTSSSLESAFQMAAKNIGLMFTRLYYYLENQMLVNVDYADFFSMVKGNNVGILRLLRKVDFDWHWGIWDRGLVNILVGEKVPLNYAHKILSMFQSLLKEKDIIWGVKMEEGLKDQVEILSLLVKGW